MSDDTISRDAAIDAIFKTCRRTCTLSHELEKAFERLPSAQPEPSQVARDIATIIENEQDMRVIERNAQRWIPCGEKYPEPDDRVLVITGSYDYYVWDCMSGREDNYFWEDESGYYHDKYEVVAWMPLPDPWEGENNGI